ncbi:hypothetical protein AB0L65_56105 [Nonomuraea sp. NPDC052116]|uniref:hypothetical protein n=1 Tax=Nonomuraea sp. NPDC052116 TaxID=3155665 RepID=UPI00343859C0
MIALTIAVCILTIVVLICVLALVDQYRTLEVVRSELGLNDTPEAIALPEGLATPPSAAGLPAEFDGHERLIVLILSTMCSTCQTIAKRLRGEVPHGVRLVIEARSHEDAETWLVAARMPADRVIVDEEAKIATALDIMVAPSAVVFQDGRAVSAQTIPSFRQLEALLAAPEIVTVPERQAGVA